MSWNCNYCETKNDDNSIKCEVCNAISPYLHLLECKATDSINLRWQSIACDSISLSYNGFRIDVTGKSNYSITNTTSVSSISFIVKNDVGERKFTYDFHSNIPIPKKNDKPTPIIIDKHYDAVGSFSEGLASVKRDDKYGFIDKSGEEVIPCIYDMTSSFYEERAVVNRNGKISIIDKNGREVSSPLYDYNILSHNEGMYRVEKEGKQGYINMYGKVIIPCIYNISSDFSEGLAVVERNGKFGFVNKDGKEIIPLIYDLACSFSEELAAVQKNGKWGYINKRGNVDIPCKYDFSWYGHNNHRFSEGMATVVKNGQFGYINKSGYTVIPFIYSVAGPFSSGLAKVSRSTQFGYIDRKGNEVIPCTYDQASFFMKAGQQLIEVVNFVL